MRDPSTARRDPSPELPESLTRFLSAPAARAIPATPGDRRRAARSAPDQSAPKPFNRALRGTLIWTAVFNLVGFALLWWMWVTISPPG